MLAGKMAIKRAIISQAATGLVPAGINNKAKTIFGYEHSAPMGLLGTNQSIEEETHSVKEKSKSVGTQQVDGG